MTNVSNFLASLLITFSTGIFLKILQLVCDYMWPSHVLSLCCPDRSQVSVTFYCQTEKSFARQQKIVIIAELQQML